MSDMTDIMDAVLAEVEDAVSGVVTQRSETPYSNINVPLFAETFNGAGSVELLDIGRQEKRTSTFTLAVVTRGKNQDEMLTYLDDLQTELDGDRTLGGIVDWCWISEWSETAILEGDSEDIDRRALVMTVSAEKVV